MRGYCNSRCEGVVQKETTNKKQKNKNKNAVFKRENFEEKQGKYNLSLTGLIRNHVRSITLLTVIPKILPVHNEYSSLEIRFNRWG